MSDKNFYNISGDDKGNVWVNDTQVFWAYQPGMRELEVPDLIVPPPDPSVPGDKGFSDALKVSGIRRLKIKCGVIDARHCIEDAIDINHSEAVEIEVDTLYAAKRYCSTQKGASLDVKTTVRRQIGHGKETDYDLGNKSDQAKGRTRQISLDITTEDRSVVAVRVMHAHRPALLNKATQRYKVNGWLKGWISYLFFLF